MPQTQKPLSPADEPGKVVVDLEYITRLRTECRERRLHERALLAELAELRGAKADPVDPIDAYLAAGLMTAEEPEVTP